MKTYTLFNKSLYSILLVSLILLVTFRNSENFYDVRNYIEMFGEAINGAKVNAEYSFVFISKLCNAFGLSYLGMFFIYALISLSTKLYVINYFSFKPFLVFVLYCSSYMILYEFVQMRAGAGLGMFLLSIALYKDNKKSLSGVCIVSAVLLHYSSLVLLLFLLLSMFLVKNKGKKTRISISGTCVLVLTLIIVIYSVAIVLIPMIDFKPQVFSCFHQLMQLVLPERIYQGYLYNQNIGSYTLSMKQILSFILSFLTVLIMFGKLISREWFYYYSCFMVIFSSWLYFFFSPFGVIVERVAELLILFVIFVVDGVIKRNKMMGYTLFIFVFLIFFVNLSTRATYFQL